MRSREYVAFLELLLPIIPLNTVNPFGTRSATYMVVLLRRDFMDRGDKSRVRYVNNYDRARGV